jgi:hypothetical protein
VLAERLGNLFDTLGGAIDLGFADANLLGNVTHRALVMAGLLAGSAPLLSVSNRCPNVRHRSLLFLY